MSRQWIALVLFLTASATCLPAAAAPFVLFPKAAQFPSPDGRYVVRNVESQFPTSAFVGAFRSLWVTEVATGRSRKLCDYVGVAAVSWESGDYLIITQYLARKTSRALVISASAGSVVLLDVSTLIRLLPVDLRSHLRENDHVFVEASRLEGDMFFLRVWGYGLKDPDGFRWSCEYGLQTTELACHEAPASK